LITDNNGDQSYGQIGEKNEEKEMRDHTEIIEREHTKKVDFLLSYP